MVSEVSKDTVSASSEAVERLKRALDIATKYTGGIEFGETSEGFLSFADLRALISTLRSQAEALARLDAAARLVMDGLGQRIESAPRTAVPVFAGIADLYDALIDSRAALAPEVSK